jgi:PadR family transcriptional regulator, regulatory protein AphA
MSLRHALLAVLTAEPMTAYDLTRYFDGTVAFVWRAPESQIRPELHRMATDGLVDVTEVPRGERATKRVYEITDAGLRELHDWLGEVRPVPPERDPSRLRAAHLEFASYEAARRQLTAHLEHYTARLRDWEGMVKAIEARKVPLLRERLRQRPEPEHQAMIAFRRFAFRGEVAKAKAEIAWAQEGLALIERLEAVGAPLWSGAQGRPPGQTGADAAASP